MRLIKKMLMGMGAIATVGLLAATAHAAPITFTDTFLGDGFFGPDSGLATLFRSPVTFTGTGDTSAITHQGSEFDLILSSATVSVGLSGFSGFNFVTATLTHPIEVIVNNQISFAGFEDSDQAEIVTTSPVFTTYDLSGPVTATGNLSFNDDEFVTSAGILLITGSEADSTFSAVTSSTMAPEPSTMALLGTSLLGLGGLVRRRMRRV
jgi:PEP-CTERM motif